MMHLKCIFVLSFVLLVCSMPSSKFNEGANIEGLLQKYNPSNVEDAFYLVESLRFLSSRPTDKSVLCALANDVLSDPKDIRSVYFAAIVAEDLSCGKRANEKLAGKLFSMKTNAETTEELFYTTMAAYKLKENKHISFEDTNFIGFVEDFNELTGMDGTVKNTVNDQRGDFYHTGLAFQAVATLCASGHGDYESLQESIEELLELTSETADGVMFIDGGDSRTSFRTTHTLLRGSLALTDDTDLIEEAGILDDITEHILNNIPYGSLEDMYHFLGLIDLITSGQVSSPPVLSLQTNTFSAKGNTNLVVELSDLVGKPVLNAKVFIMKASTFNDEVVLYSNQPMSKVGTKYEFNFFSSKPQQGFYNVEFGVQIDNQPIKSTYRTVKVVALVSVDSVSVASIDSMDRDVSHSATVKSGKSFATFKATYYEFLEFKFAIKNRASNKPVRVQQAFIHFSGEGSEESFPVSFKDGSYKLLLDMKDAGRNLLFLSGDYEISLIVGDPFIENSFVWKLGTVEMVFPPSLVVTSQESVYEKKADIEHTFRQPDRRPSESVSFGFTVGVLAPLPVLLLVILVVGIPFKFPSGLAVITTLIFLVSLFASFSVIGMYWLGYQNMFDTLKYLLALTLPMILSGNRTLKAKGLARRATQDSQKAKQE